eukprot:jgi/Picre1/33672/NNA_001151.t1
MHKRYVVFKHFDKCYERKGPFLNQSFLDGRNRETCETSKDHLFGALHSQGLLALPAQRPSPCTSKDPHSSNTSLLCGLCCRTFDRIDRMCRLVCQRPV